MKTKRATGTGFLKAGRHLIMGIMMLAGMTTAAADKVALPLYRVKNISFDQLVKFLKEVHTNSGFTLDSEDIHESPTGAFNVNTVKTASIKFIYKNELGNPAIGIVRWFLQERIITEGKCNPCVIQRSTYTMEGGYQEGSSSTTDQINNGIKRLEPLFDAASDKVMEQVKTVIENDKTRPYGMSE